MTRARAGAAALLVLAVAGGGAALAARSWWENALSAPARAGGPLIFEVPRGAAFREVAAGLEAIGAVRDARAFSWLARVEKKDGQLRAGEYQIPPGLSAHRVLELLVEGRVRLHRVVVPEGLTLVEIAQRFAAAGFGSEAEFVALARDPVLVKGLRVTGETLEGYLFPETYQLPRGATPRQIVETQLAQFERAWREIAPLAAKRGISKRDCVVLASLIEKETGAPAERPLISAVFHNRLARGMRLETDPTVIYGIANFDGNLKRAHLEDESNPYNTYRIPGLPPGPIANPGAAALRAAVEPTPGVQYLFFVARGDGTHEFTTNYRDHVNAVNRFQLRRKRR